MSDRFELTLNVEGRERTWTLDFADGVTQWDVGDSTIGAVTLKKLPYPGPITFEGVTFLEPPDPWQERSDPAARRARTPRPNTH